MAIKTKENLAQQYLAQLSSLNPNINIVSQGSYFDVESQVYGGTLSGVYYDLDQFDKSLVPTNSSLQFVERYLSALGQRGRKSGTKAKGYILVTPSNPEEVLTIPANTKFRFPLVETEGFQTKYYFTDTLITIPVNSQGFLPVTAEFEGAEYNLVQGAQLAVEGALEDKILSAVTQIIGGGAGIENVWEMVNRTLTYLQTPASNGRGSDYETVAQQFPNVRNVYSRNLVDAGGYVYGVALATGGTISNMSQALYNPEINQFILSPEDNQAIYKALKQFIPATDVVSVYSPLTTKIDSVKASVQFTSTTLTVEDIQLAIREALLNYSFTPLDDDFHYIIYWSDIEGYVQELFGERLRFINICKDDGRTDLGTEIVIGVDCLLRNILVTEAESE